MCPFSRSIQVLYHRSKDPSVSSLCTFFVIQTEETCSIRVLADPATPTVEIARVPQIGRGKSGGIFISAKGARHSNGFFCYTTFFFVKDKSHIRCFSFCHTLYFHLFVAVIPINGTFKKGVRKRRPHLL